ncbi:MAG: transposase family protein [Cyanobacteria bacterium J06638_22]
MTYERICQLTPSDFRRYCGVSPETFANMSQAIAPTLPNVGQRGGQPGFSVEDQLLMTLEYWREYRTFFHLAVSWQTSEATVCRTISRVETALAACGYSQLPGNKSLSGETDLAPEVIVVDVSESPIERPKKTKRPTSVARNASTP